MNDLLKLSIAGVSAPGILAALPFILFFPADCLAETVVRYAYEGPNLERISCPAVQCPISGKITGVVIFDQAQLTYRNPTPKSVTLRAAGYTLTWPGNANIDGFGCAFSGGDPQHSQFHYCTGLVQSLDGSISIGINVYHPSADIQDDLVQHQDLRSGLADAIGVGKGPGVWSRDAPTDCYIDSQTLTSVPDSENSDSRQTIGVDEWVKLTSNVEVDWSVSSGLGVLTDLIIDKNTGAKRCSEVRNGRSLGKEVCLTAPNRGGDTVVTAKPSDGGSSCFKKFSVVPPSGLIFRRLMSPPLARPGYGVQILGDYYFGAAMWTVAFLTPGNVSFNNIEIFEKDVDFPHLAYHYNPPVLVAIADTTAWLLGCDSDIDRYTVSKTHDWYYRYEGNDTPFSKVRTTLEYQSGGSLVFRKIQVQSLMGEPTTDTEGSVLTVSAANLAISSLPDLGPAAASSTDNCLRDVRNQFKVVH